MKILAQRTLTSATIGSVWVCSKKRLSHFAGIPAVCRGTGTFMLKFPASPWRAATLVSLGSPITLLSSSLSASVSPWVCLSVCPDSACLYFCLFQPLSIRPSSSGYKIPRYLGKDSYKMLTLALSLTESYWKQPKISLIINNV